MNERGPGRPSAGDKLKKKLVCFRADEETYAQVKLACELEGTIMTDLCRDVTMRRVKSILLSHLGKEIKHKRAKIKD